MRFQDVERAIAGVPFMTSWQGRRVYDHLRDTGARDVLELGTAHGASAAYMAAAVAANGGGRVTTIDRFHFQGPSPEETLERAGLRDAVDLVRVPDSSYDWWLAERVRERSDAAGNCEPAYDFCYLDGMHDLHVDGVAVVLVEKLLRPGAWLLLDDLDWTYEAGTVPGAEKLSEDERTTPHMRVVWDLIVRPHPAFTELRDEDGTWGWARKAPGEPKRLTVSVTREERSILARRLALAARRLRRSAR
ncbi:MAG TPA: class I SAM-dependent methyltransferase [Solirubrobacteraceae bacterium]|nr:class I SAM-dependent methyltransferase [Solirubrobacteraceae bacterium]